MQAKVTAARVFDLSDPKAYWLTITNIGLGILVLACILVAVSALFEDMAGRMRNRSHRTH